MSGSRGRHDDLRLHRRDRDPGAAPRTGLPCRRRSGPVRETPLRRYRRPGHLVWDEIYYSTSGRGVIRGMHLQLPPHDHTKAVHCVAGRALDVVVDLRTQSPTLGRHAVIELDSTEPSLVVVPPGCAHGFQALDDDTLMLYLVSSVHAPAFDSGIRWDSFGCAWPLPASEISDRDRSLPDLTTFRKAEHGPWSTCRPRGRPSSPGPPGSCRVSSSGVSSPTGGR